VPAREETAVDSDALRRPVTGAERLSAVCGVLIIRVICIVGSSSADC
jgi:hypothetical protein